MRIDFQKCFMELTGSEPFRWQIKLFEEFVRGSFPRTCDIPTGLGKTNVLVIWLLALAKHLQDEPAGSPIPRRLVYVVDRRTVVDQSTDEAENLLVKLKNAGEVSALAEVYRIFRSASKVADKEGNPIIALSTLRGQNADNREWCLDPSRPAIIVGTVDMIGSRLLFSGYGKVGRNHKPLQAGLIGQDVLLVVDEAHLSPAFVASLDEINKYINASPTIRPFHWMRLSATTVDDESSKHFGKFEFDETAEIDHGGEAGNIAEKRLYARKWLAWSYVEHQPSAKEKDRKAEIKQLTVGRIVEKALVHEPHSRSVVIFVRTIEMVNEIADGLIEKLGEEAEHRILRLTGEMRGNERDELAESDKFKRFLPKRDRSTDHPTHYLIATSCAEVGVNFDGDECVCDLSSLDGMIQRFGRVNRFGETESSVTVVTDLNALKATEADIEGGAEFKNFERADSVLFHTWKALRNEESVSPVALRKLHRDEKAFPPEPVVPPLDRARLDDWSMTSLKPEEYPRPLVQYWLRGVIADDSVQTTFCWRAELNHAGSPEQAISFVGMIPIAARERAVVATYRAEKTLKELAKRHPATFAVIIGPDGEYKSLELEQLADDPTLFKRIAFATVVLPCVVGGLNKDGNVDPKSQQFVPDVASADWTRYLLIGTSPDAVRWKELDRTAKTDDDGQFTAGSISGFLSERRKSDDGLCENLKELRLAFSKPDDETDEDDERPDEEQSKTKEHTTIAYCLKRTSPDRFQRDADDDGGSLEFHDGQTVTDHNRFVGEYARDIARRVGLPDDLVEALGIAGDRHDLGKARWWWQAAIGNKVPPNPPLAKSWENTFDHNLNRNYRHEFGSLVESVQELADHPRGDLILHLIASHHGYARPHFRPEAYDRDQPTAVCRRIADDAMHRFVALQNEYGWWQLAFLEAVLKAADALASRDFTEGNQ